MKMSGRVAKPRRGLTLVESVLSLVIVTTLIVMALNTFGSVAKAQQVSVSHYIGSSLANQLMSEILQNKYRQSLGDVFGLEQGKRNTVRADFDDVDDYHNWSECPPQAKDGTVMPGLAGWTRGAKVEYVNPDSLALAGADLGLKRITVTVTSPQGVKTVLVTLRSANGSYDQVPAQQTTCVSWVGVELQSGSDSAAKVVSGAGLPNIVPGAP